VSRVESYKLFENEIKIDSFPVHITDIKKIEHENNININVFSLIISGSIEVKIGDCKLESLYLSKNYDEAINILHYQNHYMYIKNINTFFNSNTKQRMNATSNFGKMKRFLMKI
jgi:hypothetical protein